MERATCITGRSSRSKHSRSRSHGPTCRAAISPAPCWSNPKRHRPTIAHVVLALGTRDDDDLARLRAGEATSLVLLTATALGLATSRSPNRWRYRRRGRQYARTSSRR